MKKIYLKITIFFLVFVFGVFIGVLSQRKNTTIENTISILLKEYDGQKEYTRQELEKSALKGIFSSLNDKYTRYIENPKPYVFYDNGSEKLNFGIKVGNEKIGNYYPIISVYENSPAHKSKISEYDLITKVDGIDTSNLSFDEVYSKFNNNSKIKLEILRPSTNEVKIYNLSKDYIKTKFVDYQMISKDIGYISLTEFEKGTFLEIKNAIITMQNNGMKNLILDLRHNPGGNAQEASKILSLFLDEKIRNTFKFINKRTNKEALYFNEHPQIFSNNLVILVDNNSASASEVISDTLRAKYPKITIIGEKTFGKFTLQKFFPFKDRTGGFWMTQYTYVSPTGKSLNKIGLTPDYEIKQENLLKMINFNSQGIREKNIEKILIVKYGEQKARQIINNGDLQLKLAIKLSMSHKNGN